MLISKKSLHFTNIFTQKINSKKINKILNLNIISILQCKKIFIVYSFLFNIFNWFSLKNFYINKHNIKFKISTKYLFLFTSYTICSILNNFVNLFFFKFHFLIKKQKKYSILRAPCNHKNSKEQFGIVNYKAILTGNVIYIKNNFYNDFFFSFFSDKKLVGLTKIYNKYEKKNVS